MLYAAVLDTCVLYPATLRDSLLSLAESGLYRPLWTEDILAELRVALIRRPGPGSPPEREVQVDRLLAEMRAAFEDALVTGHEPLVQTMTNHPKDRHVLAAGVCGGAAAIVTYNLADYAQSATEPLEIEAVHPDEFLLNQLDLDPEQVRVVLAQQVGRNRKPPQSIEQLAETFARERAPRFRGSSALDDVGAEAEASVDRIVGQRTRMLHRRQHCGRSSAPWVLGSSAIMQDTGLRQAPPGPVRSRGVGGSCLPRAAAGLPAPRHGR